MRIRFTALVLAASFALPAVAARPTLPATPITTPGPVEVVLTQQELAVDVPDTSAASMQFGLLGALVGTAITNAQVKNGEQRVAQLRDLLLDYPFNARMEAALRDKLAANDTIGAQGIKVLDATWDAADPANAGTSATALVLTPRYAITNNFELLSVKLGVGYVERIARTGKKPKQKSYFSRTYAFNFPLAKVSGSGADEDAARWVALGRDQLAGMLDLGIDQVTDMLVYDLSSEGRAEAALSIRGQKGSIGAQTFPGRVVREGDGWLWLRNGPGVLRTLVGQHPVVEAPVSAPVQADAPAEAAPTSVTEAPAEVADPANDG